MIMILKGGYAMKIDLVNELNSLELMNEWLDKIAVELKETSLGGLASVVPLD